MPVVINITYTSINLKSNMAACGNFHVFKILNGSCLAQIEDVTMVVLKNIKHSPCQWRRPFATQIHIIFAHFPIKVKLMNVIPWFILRFYYGCFKYVILAWLSNMNLTKTWGWNQMIWNGKKILLHQWHPCFNLSLINRSCVS